MNEPYERRDNEHFVSQLTVVDSLDALTPELSTIREARMRAVNARVAAENALREAEEAEAGLLAREAQVVAAATAARREQAAEFARIAANKEREAIEHLATIEAQLDQSTQAMERAQIAARSVTQARDEAQRTLDRLDASLAELEEQLRVAGASKRSLEAELVLVRQQANDATRAREQAESFTPTVPFAIAVPPAATAPPSTRPQAVSDLLAIAAQRAAERRAADAARAQQQP